MGRPVIVLIPSIQVLERLSGKASLDCLDLFRHLMVDVIACTVFGSRSGSLDNWATNIRDPLSIAVYDFPKRGIMVSSDRTAPYKRRT